MLNSKNSFIKLCYKSARKIASFLPEGLRKKIDFYAVRLFFIYKNKYPQFLLDFDDVLGRQNISNGYYSQRGQDFFLFEKIFSKKTDGFYIDVGGNDPIELSNTYFFEKKGWNGIAFEPQSRFQQMWKEQRKTECMPYLLGSKDDVSVDFISVDVADWKNALSGVAGYMDETTTSLKDENLNISKMPMYRLDTILKQRNIKDIDFISIDVEGFEMEVLKGINLSEFNIKALIIENDRTVLGDQHIQQYIVDQGYKHVARLSGDDIFVKAELLN